MLLAGDIGGTKTTLALFTAEAGLRDPILARTFPSTSYSRLEAIISEFLAQTDLRPHRATFGVAGPVVDGQAAVTNLSWVISEAHIQREFGFAEVHLLNDLEAIAEAVPILQPDDLATLRPGSRVEGGTIAVIAPGTGLGEAFLTWDGAQYRSHASEGGHANFGPRDEREIDLLRYLLARYENVSYERVCSGSGFPNIYAFLRDRSSGTEPDWLTRQLAEAADLTPVIVNAALSAEPRCELCEAALHMFVAILGSEAGNLALKVLSTGGLYVGGGIPPRILPLLRTSLFLDALLSKGRLSMVLDKMPVHVILNPGVGLLGAANYGFKMLVGRSKSHE